MGYSTANALATCWDDALDTRSDGTTVLDPGRPPLPVADGWAVMRPSLHLVDDRGRYLPAGAVHALPPAERTRLTRYGRVAESEHRSMRGGLLLRAQRFEIDELIFERPATLAGADLAAGFQPEHLRVWHVGQRWDGLTRLGDRRPRPLALTTRRIRTLLERLCIELRLAACSEPLRALPRAGELLALLRRELGLRPPTKTPPPTAPTR
ncbi:hypothetical protein EPN52_07160 [bacterium]|nr:MAG: hypothetical protein EPN52_07160 [bacterium]